jgi:hypothetical protein
VSGPTVGRELVSLGHDVLALDQHSELDGLDDEEVLALASAECRILITHNVADFPAILRSWAESGRSHSGVILVYGVLHHEFALIIGGVQRWLEIRDVQEDWVDFPAILDRGFASRS